MRDKRDGIIADLEAEYDMELGDFDASINGLCDGDTCRHLECDCWDNFAVAAREQLERQKVSV